MKLRDVIEEILRTRDFQLGDVDGFLVGQRGDLEVAFCLLSPDSPNMVERFLDTFSGFDGRKVVASLYQDLPYHLEGEVFLWDREAIEHEIGRMHVERIIGEPDLGFVDELSATDYPRMISPEELERLGSQDLSRRILRPNLDIKAVRNLSNRTVGGFRHHLELIPYYVYAYRCRVRIGDEDKGLSTGTIAVNALNQEIVTFKGSLDAVCDLDLRHRRMEPLVDGEDAETLVMSEIIRKHTVKREVVWGNETATVTEEKRYAPTMEDLVVDDLGIYYVPIWCVEGVKGEMYVNANTGKVIRESYHRS